MKLSDLLQTKNSKEQEQRVAQLLARTQNPVIHLAISFDPLTRQATIQTIGGQVPAELVIDILAAVRDDMVAQVAEVRAKRAEESAEN